MIDRDDPTYRQTVGRAAYALVGSGFDQRTIPDFRHKFELFREMFCMNSRAWPDNVFARLLFGEPVVVSAGTFSKKKKGDVAFTGEDGAAIAQLMNFFAQFSPEQLSSYQHKLIDAAATEFMMTRAPGNASLRAVDLTLPMLDFAGRLAALVSAQAGANLDALHDRAMSYLTGLRLRADQAQPAMLGQARERDPNPSRFGDSQTKPKQPPYDWEPRVLRAGDRPVVGLDAVMDQPCELWALTIRDPRPPRPFGREGPYCWDESWENLVRWSVPAETIAAGQALVVDYGAIVDKRGDFSLFLLADAGATGAVRDQLGVARGQDVPVQGLHQLLAAAADPKEPLGFHCFARRYRVRSGA